MEIRCYYNRLISTMGFPILVRWHLYIEVGPWGGLNINMSSCQIPMLEIRRSRHCLIFNMGLHIAGKDGPYIEVGPWSLMSSNIACLVPVLPWYLWAEVIESHPDHFCQLRKAEGARCFCKVFIYFECGRCWLLVIEQAFAALFYFAC